MRRALLILFALLMPAAARAEWREATSKHFIVYSEESEPKLRQTVAKLEKYDFLLRFVANIKRPPTPVKLKVYMLASGDAVRSTLYDAAGTGILGYYEAHSRGPLAVTPGFDEDLGAQAVLFHEYAHHIMFQYFPAAYPSWYTEGFAEYYGTARILDKDLIEVGQPALGRYDTFRYADWLPMDKLLAARSYADVGNGIYSLYAEGWLLVHYLSGTKERSDQLTKYLSAINAGKDYKAAADEAFGPGARELDNALHSYVNRHRLETLRLPFRPIDVGPVEIRRLGPAEEALMTYDIRLGRGLLAIEAADFVRDVRAIAARFPNDGYALSILAEAERAAGNKAAAMAAADRWLAVQPRSARALTMKAMLEIDALKAAHVTDAAAWEAPRKRLVEASRIDPKDPLVLETYYDSFLGAGRLPPEHAQNALYSAFELVPQDSRLRYKLAWDFEQRGLIEDAIGIIKPVAFQLPDNQIEDPKKKAKAERQREKYREAGVERPGETAREMLARLEKKLAAAKGGG